MPNQMKPVENQRGIGEIFADRLGIRRPHVATDRVDRAAASGVQPAEKRIECFFLPVFTNPDELMPLDRKSTRLNSSHRCISYAVFCLKKKKKKCYKEHTN